MTTFARMQLRRGTTAQWSNTNPILLLGEPGIEELPDGTTLLKVGDGTRPWNSLLYFAGVVVWNQITSKPAVIAAGDTQAIARAAIGAVSIDDIDNAVQGLLSGAPGQLDTLKELADAIGDDANFAATITTALAAKAYGLTPTGVKTAAYTAAPGDLVPVDATSAAQTITLPTGAGDKTRVAVKKLDASTNLVTITAASGDVFNKTGGSASLTLTLTNQLVSLQYSAAAHIWYVTGDDMPLGALDSRNDARYDAIGAATTALASAKTYADTVVANRQTGTTYTFVLTDVSKVIEMNNAAANTVTVPPNSSVAFPVGTVIELLQYGAGQTTIAAGSGVTIRSAGAKLKLSGQYSGGALRKIATDEWALVGDLAA